MTDLLHLLQQWPLEAVLAIIAGILILAVPRLLNYAIAVYLLVVGLLGLLQAFYGQPIRAETIAALVSGILILVRPAILHYVVAGYLILVGLLQLGLF